MFIFYFWSSQFLRLLQQVEGTKKIKPKSFHQYSWNSEVDTTWISLIGRPHKTSKFIMMLCKICCSPRFVACFCGDFVKQIEIGQSQKVAKKLNELHARYWILAQTIYDAVSHSWRNPMTYSCHFFACEYFCTSKWVPLFHLFSRNINVKKNERNHWKTQTITTYFLIIVIFFHFTH